LSSKATAFDGKSAVLLSMPDKKGETAGFTPPALADDFAAGTRLFRKNP
jgi:hypothetical protein